MEVNNQELIHLHMTQFSLIQCYYFIRNIWNTHDVIYQGNKIDGFIFLWGFIIHSCFHCHTPWNLATHSRQWLLVARWWSQAPIRCLVVGLLLCWESARCRDTQSLLSLPLQLLMSDLMNCLILWNHNFCSILILLSLH